MGSLRQFLFRLRPLWRRRRIEAEFAEEIRSHLELATEAHVAAGLSPTEARRAAEREFGGLEQIKESWRDQRGLPWLDHLQQDGRAAWRSLCKTPGFTAIALVSLAVAIGVNTTVFSILNGLLLRPLAPGHNESLVSLYVSAEGQGYRLFSHSEYLALRAARDTFVDVAATYPTFASISDSTGLHRGVAFFVSENFFSMLGVTPQLGRFFTAEECRPNVRHAVVVVSHSFWQRLGGRADFVGSAVRLNGELYTVIGVAPPTFSGLNVLIATDCWAPLGVFGHFGGSAFGETQPDLARPESTTLFLTARLTAPLTLESATQRLPALAEGLPPSTRARQLAIGRPSRENIGSFGPSTDGIVHLAYGFLVVSGCVLLIAGFNLGHLFLARGADRAKEIALRTALGATRGRIVRQLLMEGLLLALAGGALGLALSLWANRAIYASGATLNGTRCTFALNLSPDGRVLAATLLCCLLITLLFSFIPALRASRVDLVQDLKHLGGDAAAAHRLGRFFAWRHVALMLQLALGLVVVYSASLFVRGALRASRAPLGFDPAPGAVVELDYSLKATPFADTQRSIAAALARARAQPGVLAAAATTLLPCGNIAASKRLEPAVGPAPDHPAIQASASYAAVTPGYLEALGVKLLRGRDLTTAEADDPASPYVAIVDEGLAQRLFPGRDPIGQRIREPGRKRYSPTPAAGAAPDYEIVGICSSHRHDLREQEPASLYVPLAAEPAYRGSLYLQIRYASADPAVLAAAIEPLRRALLSGDPELPLAQTAPFVSLLGRHVPLWEARGGAVLLGICASIALLLAVVGIYGVKAYTVARRTREIGIRLALGAPPGSAFALILNQAVGQVALGLLAGMVLALGVGRLLVRFVYGLTGLDTWALLAAAFLLALATVGACWLPARRATRVDPIRALRCE